MGRTGRRRPPAEIAAARVGRLERRWTPRAVESHDHALWVWEGVRRAVAARAWSLHLLTRPGGVAALEGQVDLSLLHHLGAHLDTCGLCWEVWTDGYRPGDLLTQAVRRRPAGQILRAIEAEQRAHGKRKQPRRSR